MARLRPGSSALIRDLNRAAILGAVGRYGPIARSEIAQRLSLSPATVTAVTRTLVDDGLLSVVAQAPSRGGRPGLLLAIVGAAAQVVGVKIAVDHISCVRVDLNGTVLERCGATMDLAAGDPTDRIVALLRELIPGALRRDGSPVPAGQPRLLGIGLGVPGIVDVHRGSVRSPHLGWRDLPLGSQLRARLRVPVLVDNDVNTLAIAERLDGRGRDLDHFITVTIGRGVGLGIVVGGDVYRGARGGAGEFGHLRVVDDGPRCECGKRGCLESLVSDAALCEVARDQGLFGARPPAITETEYLRALADRGDHAARAIYARAGEVLGRAVAGLVSVLDPQLVIVSGEGTQAWPHLNAAFSDALAADVFGPLGSVNVEIDPWDDSRWARGAAALVLQAGFSAPLYERSASDQIRDRLVNPRPES